MSQPFKLYRLQQIDSQLDQVRQRLKEIEAALSDDEALRQARGVNEAAALRLQEAQKVLRRAEEAVNEQRVKIEQAEAALYGGRIRNPKELQDLQNEAAALKRYRSVLEDHQLEAMLAEEEAQGALQTAQEAYAQVREQGDRQQAVLTEEQAHLNRDLARMEGERQAAAGSIPESDLALYEQLRRQRRGIAVAQVRERACSACGSVLSAALLHAARSPNQITRCESCSRILYIG